MRRAAWRLCERQASLRRSSRGNQMNGSPGGGCVRIMRPLPVEDVQPVTYSGQWRQDDLGGDPGPDEARRQAMGGHWPVPFSSLSAKMRSTWQTGGGWKLARPLAESAAQMGSPNISRTARRGLDPFGDAHHGRRGVETHGASANRGDCRHQLLLRHHIAEEYSHAPTAAHRRGCEQGRPRPATCTRSLRGKARCGPSRSEK